MRLGVLATKLQHDWPHIKRKNRRETANRAGAWACKLLGWPIWEEVENTSAPAMDSSIRKELEEMDGDDG